MNFIALCPKQTCFTNFQSPLSDLPWRPFLHKCYHKNCRTFSRPTKQALFFTASGHWLTDTQTIKFPLFYMGDPNSAAASGLLSQLSWRASRRKVREKLSARKKAKLLFSTLENRRSEKICVCATTQNKKGRKINVIVSKRYFCSFFKLALTLRGSFWALLRMAFKLMLLVQLINELIVEEGIVRNWRITYFL